MWPKRPNAADHLVAHEQHLVVVADLAHPGPVALGRGERAAGVLHRFHEHRSDRFRPFHLDPQREVVGTPQRAGVEVHAVVAAVSVGRLHLDRAGQQWLEDRS